MLNWLKSPWLVKKKKNITTHRHRALTALIAFSVAFCAKFLSPKNARYWIIGWHLYRRVEALAYWDFCIESHWGKFPLKLQICFRKHLKLWFPTTSLLESGVSATTGSFWTVCQHIRRMCFAGASSAQCSATTHCRKMWWRNQV